MASRLSSLLTATPLASASSFIQLDRQLRQKPARFIKSMFWTSVRARRWLTRRRKTAASSSVLVLSSIVMVLGSCVIGGRAHSGGNCHRFCHICAQKWVSHVASRFPIARERRARALTGPAGSREIVNDLI